MSLKTTVYEKLTDVSNFFTSPLSVSKFLEEGVLTPEEFVQAGDLLVLKCPSWSWHGSKITQKGLPPERQYLLTKNVPSSMRVCALEAKSSTVENKYVEEDDGEGGWIATHCNEAPQADEDIPEILAVRQNNLQGNSLDDEDDEDIPEINLDDMSFEGNGELEDQATIHSENVVKTRTYDISICYDQFHQTPRVWLFGYDEQRRPLSPEAVLQDISQEHAKKNSDHRSPSPHRCFSGVHSPMQAWRSDEKAGSSYGGK